MLILNRVNLNIFLKWTRKQNINNLQNSVIAIFFLLSSRTSYLAEFLLFYEKLEVRPAIGEFKININQ